MVTFTEEEKARLDGIDAAKLEGIEAGAERGVDDERYARDDPRRSATPEALKEAGLADLHASVLRDMRALADRLCDMENAYDEHGFYWTHNKAELQCYLNDSITEMEEGRG